MQVACVHIPRFAVEAERRRHKNINTRLILIGGSTVLDCSLGAEVSKVRRGMRMSEAIGLCPGAAVIPADIPYYERFFGQVLDLLEETSPEVESVSAGTAYVGLDGHPTPSAYLAEDIISRIHKCFGFMPSIGIARGKFTAWTAATIARAGSVKVIPDGEEGAFLAQLTVDHLPAADAIRWRLTMLGLGTIGEIAHLPLGAMQAQFGPEGKRLWELAHGIDNSPIIPRVHERTMRKRLEMPAPATTLDAICIATEQLIDECFAELQGGRWVRKAIVRATLERDGSWELPVHFREALSNPKDAWFAVKTAVLRSPPTRPVEDIEIELTGLSGETGKQASMFKAKGKQWRQIAEAIRQVDVQQGTGETQLGRVISVEPWSRIPERRAALGDFAKRQ